MSKTLKGIAASDGIAVAPAYLLVEPDLSFSKTSVSDVDAEVARFKKVVEESTKELEKVRDKAKESLGAEEAQVFDAHLLFLSDPEFTGAIEQEIKDQKVNAEAALDETAQKFITIFEGMTDNAYMQERAADVRDVSKRLMAHLLGKKLPDPAAIDHEVVVVAYDLTPSDTAQLNKKYVKGFVTDVGGRTAHSAIMARSLEIPAVVGTETITKDVKDGDMLIADGLDGDAIINPTNAQIEEYTKKGEAFAKQKEEWKKLKNEPSVTANGKKFIIAANIGTPNDMKGVKENGAEAIGLYRTEFLYMDSKDFPSEEAQFDAYKKVIEDMDGKQTIIRTCDIGGDKHLDYWDLPEEMNPFLGVRAIRLSMQYKDIFRTQLRALLRASAYGPLGIMFPMIGTLAELREAKQILAEEKDKLAKEGVKIGEDLQVGMMIEVPAAAVLADQFAKEVDFFSIGTNDLIQYTMAADRGNDNVSYLYQPYNPSVLRLIKHTIDGAHENGIWCGMCGEAAGDDIMFPILLSMGLDEYSMSATSILRIRSLMKKINTDDIKELANKACFVSETADENKKLVEETMKKLGIID
ncbi:phosphoenolpyruvate-protein phosphotransferase (enzyme I) [Lactobacillus taiwanensis DSM 21401]|jgi:phosphoenolpyruvate-protein phosphotransferase|uniref:Phosphoenolpyruvate-protein phosphotransferase n=2 Tax=Lactobacillus taiwanensis TaxID=508451 RepID=A0A256LFX4_9LACO|nr:phosphoenolpyruvate--protein phosphotransferase [Lactobacillus taiwanensis]KRM98383.1 phosphoenolpyruvate-protein phosphotransferase (enzyme I) [Lactobacillus taiwanensis DSM 21401]OYR88313.1 phosphoenolpyruvate--protein phosphotransferase [Lactobacillus taiwanensis]OYR91817.1 phosphoenolpyruvate--protein phosphotransferase [Lactobacillus taiwanensis]OYR92331.1 phosphoenolpyruvate--protein phosphotransferase [Lactobacillus taiwanensis]OYR95722.1 phosphoenolpyruvate--protein phosphotransfera